MNGGDPLEWYNEIPVVSRVYLTLSFVTTAACALDLVSPFSLYFNYKLIVDKGQFWRLFTNFFFFGMFSVDFLFHMYFLVRYSRLLEDGYFRGRTADFLFMLLVGATVMTVHLFSLSLYFVQICIHTHTHTYIHVYLDCCAFCERSVSRILVNIYDGVYLGTAESNGKNEFSRSVPIYSTISPLGSLLILSDVRKQCNDRSGGYRRWSYLLLS
jgi:hypothetical protein